MERGGDSIEVGDISGSAGVAIGRGTQAHVTQGISRDQLTLWGWACEVLGSDQLSRLERGTRHHL